MSWFNKLVGKGSGKKGESAMRAAGGAVEEVLPESLSVNDDISATISDLVNLGDEMTRIAVPDQAEQVDKLVGVVLEHFGENRPEPASFPSLATRVIDLVEQPNADLAEVARLIERDPAISASILRVANSALYRRGNEVETVKAAITQLGLFQVANLAVGVACRSLYDVEAQAEYEMFAQRWSRLSHHAMTTAFSTSWFAMNQKVARFDHSFMGGLFHDIGKTVALRSLAALMIERKVPKPIPDPVIDELLERIHIQVGVELHTTWSLPKFLSEMCQRHHDDDLPDGPESAELHMLRVVSGLNMFRVDPASPKHVLGEVVASARILRMDQSLLAMLFERIRDFAEKVSSLYGIPDYSRRPAD